MKVGQIVFSVVVMSVVAGTALAADVRSVQDGTYTDGATWSDGNAPSAGNNYEITNLVGITTAYSATLAGDSLTISSGGTYRHTLNTSNTKPLTTPPLTLNGGRLEIMRTDKVYSFHLNFQSDMDVSSDSTIKIGYGNTKYDAYVYFYGALTGSGNIDLIGNIGDDSGDWAYVHFTTANSTFSGNWNVYSIDSGSVNLIADAEKAIGSGSVTLGKRGILTVNATHGIDNITNVTLSGISPQLQLTHAWSNATATLSMTDGLLDLSSNDSYVAAMEIDGIPVAQGTYSAEDLTVRGYGFGVSFTGSGSLTILDAVAGSDITSIAGSSNNGGWNEAAVWSNGEVASGTNHYTIDGEDVTCAKDGSSTFAGGSLTVTSGILRMSRSSSGTATASAANFTLSGGQLLFRSYTSYNSTFNWQSAIHFAAGTTSTIQLNGGIYTHYGNLNGPLTGSGNVNVIINRADTGDSRSFVVANYADNTFSGNWNVTGYDDGAVGYLVAGAANALGTGTVTLGSRGALDVTAANGIDSLANITLEDSTSKLVLTQAWSNENATLTMADGILDLVNTTNYIHRLHIAGHNVKTGSYTATDLTNLGYGGTFTGSGELNIMYEAEGTVISIQ